MENDRILRWGGFALAAGVLAVLLGCQSGCGKADPDAAEAYRIAQRTVALLSDPGKKLDFPPQPERITKSAAGEYEVESYVTDPNQPASAGRLCWRARVRRTKERWEIGSLSVRPAGQNSWEEILDSHWTAAP